jgi:ABC-type glycerol-3-phosphate transport system permease component
MTGTLLTTKRQREVVWKTIWYVTFIALAFVFLLPLIWMISTSLKQQHEVFELPIHWIPDKVMWRNYSDAWANPRGATTFTRFTFNSFVVSGCVTMIHVFLASLAGYGLAKYKFAGRRLLLLAILATMMLPIEVIMVPLFLRIRDLGWLDSYQGLIAPLVADAFGVFLMRQFFLQLPDSLLEAARVDGAGHIRIFFRIAVPLSWPALATLSIFIFRETWDEFLWALLVVQSGDMRTIPLGIKVFDSANLTNFPQIMAISTLATIPLAMLFFIFQKAFVRGIALTGMKE